MTPCDVVKNCYIRDPICYLRRRFGCLHYEHVLERMMYERRKQQRRDQDLETELSKDIKLQIERAGI